MNVVTLAAGRIRFAVPELLSLEHHDVTVIDRDAAVLERVSAELDVATRLGSGTDWKLLEEVMESSPDLFLALTGVDETNFSACAIAKGLGFKETVARLTNWNYLNTTRLDFGRIFAVDHFVSPEVLAAQEIYQYLLSLGSVKLESYAHGAVQMRTLTIPLKWPKAGRPIFELAIPEGLVMGLISRPLAPGKGRAGERYQIIFPHGKDCFYPGDEVTLIGTAEEAEQAHLFFGVPQHRVGSAVIVGGGRVGLHIAKTLSQRGAKVRLIEKNRQRCIELSELLPYVTILHHDGADLAFLESERVETADVFIACTRQEEINVLISLFAREVGCKEIVVVGSSIKMAPMLKALGVSHFVSPRSSAANRVMAIARQEKVIATSSLYDNRAKIMEIKVSLESKIVGIPLAELAPLLPDEFLFGMIQNRGRTMIARGKRILCPGDSVIVITAPKYSDKILELF